jgi:hypothetical protein
MSGEFLRFPLPLERHGRSDTVDHVDHSYIDKIGAPICHPFNRYRGETRRQGKETRKRNRKDPPKTE